MTEKKSDAQRLMDLFEGYEDAHGTYGKPTRDPNNPLKMKIQSTARTIRKPLTVTLWEQHLAGKYPLGGIPLNKHDQVKWISLDYDVYDADMFALIDKVQKLKLPLLPARSKSHGLHLFAFMQDWVDGALAIGVMQNIAARLGISGSEIFPKQTHVLLDRGDLANWITLPYLGTTYDGAIAEQVGLKRGGGEMSLTEFLNVAERMKISEAELVALGNVAPPRGAGGGKSKKKTTRKEVGEDGVERDVPVIDDQDTPFSDGPPCLQHLAVEKVQKGYQSNALMHMGVYFKRSNAAEWKEQLEQAAQLYLDPPGSAEGTSTVIKSLEKKDYQYMCKTEPMCSYCNVAVCRGRTYGVGDSGAYPIISGMQYLNTQPPIWFLDVQGGNSGNTRMEISTKELQNYTLFHLACMNQLTTVFAPMKQADWTMILSEAMQRSTTIEAPPESSERYRVRELVEEYLTNRFAGEKIEDVVAGRPWLDDEDHGGHYWFKLHSLHQFIVREGMKDVDRQRLTSSLRDMGAEAHVREIDGKSVRCFRISIKNIQPAPVLATPLRKDPGI